MTAARHPKPSRGTSGLSLIEVVVAVLILSIASVAAFRTFETVTGHSRQAADRLVAQQAALNEMAILSVGGAQILADRPETVAMAGRDIALTHGLQPTQGGYLEVTIQARTEGGVAYSISGFLPRDERDPDAP